MRNIQKWISILLLLFAMTSFNQQLFSPEELQKDFEIYINYILKAGIDPFEFVSQEKFYSEVNRIKGQLNKPMTKGEFFKTIAPIIHIFSDGHYGVFFNITPDTLVMPFEPVVVGNRLFVKNSLVNELENKAEILKIDDRNVEEIINDLKQFLPKIRSQAIYPLVSFLISYFPVIENKSTFKLLLMVDNTKKLVKITAIKYNEKLKRTKQLYTDYDKEISFERRENIGVLKIKTFNYQSQTYYKKFLERTFSENKDLSDLIIDLRGNLGGPLDNVWELFKYLIDKVQKLWGFYYVYTTVNGNKEKRLKLKYTLNTNIVPAKDNFKGKVWLLTDKQMASSAIIATYLFKKFGLGKIIGEEPQEPVNALAVGKQLYILPNTQLVVVIPNVSYWFEKEPKIVIDYERKMTENERIEWLLGNKDVMLDYVFEIINKNREESEE